MLDAMMMLITPMFRRAADIRRCRADAAAYISPLELPLRH